MHVFDIQYTCLPRYLDRYTDSESFVVRVLNTESTNTCNLYLKPEIFVQIFAKKKKKKKKTALPLFSLVIIIIIIIIRTPRDLNKPS